MASGKKHYIYSTMTSSVEYPIYRKGGADVPVSEKSVMIYGGANVPDRYMRTPDGSVITPVTDEELEALQEMPLFRLHVDNGFLKVSDKKEDSEKAAADMQGRDGSAPLVDEDFDAANQPTPVTGQPEADNPRASSNRSGRRA